jgi:predicted transposase/invertase (TIGR01784 family)
LIEEDSITPEERYDMFEESHRQEEMKSSEDVGVLKGKKEIAKNMLAKGFDLETISELTGLSLSEIEKLANPLLYDEEN